MRPNQLPGIEPYRSTGNQQSLKERKRPLAAPRTILIRLNIDRHRRHHQSQETKRNELQHNPSLDSAALPPIDHQHHRRQRHDYGLAEERRGKKKYRTQVPPPSPLEVVLMFGI